MTHYMYIIAGFLYAFCVNTTQAMEEPNNYGVSSHSAPREKNSEIIPLHLQDYTQGRAQLNSKIKFQNQAWFIQFLVKSQIDNAMLYCKHIPAEQVNSNEFHRKVTVALLKAYRYTPNTIINIYKELQKRHFVLHACDSRDMAAIAACIDSMEQKNPKRTSFLTLMHYFKQDNLVDYDSYVEEIKQNFINVKVQNRQQSKEAAQKFIDDLINEVGKPSDTNEHAINQTHYSIDEKDFPELFTPHYSYRNDF